MRIPQVKRSSEAENTKEMAILSWKNLWAYHRALRELHHSLAECDSQAQRSELVRWAELKAHLARTMIGTGRPQPIGMMQQRFHRLAIALKKATALCDQGFVTVVIDKTKREVVGVRASDLKTRLETKGVGDYETWMAIAAMVAGGVDDMPDSAEGPSYFLRRDAYPWTFADEDEWAAF